MHLPRAGHETTAAVCTWTIFCLMQNEAAEAKVLAEIDSVVGDRVPSEWAGLAGSRGGWRVLCNDTLQRRPGAATPQTAMNSFPLMQPARTLGRCPTCA